MKFIHLSNVNLNREAADACLPGIDRREEFLEDFCGVLNGCIQQSVDALFLTGNLFAGIPSEEDLAAMDELFAQLKNTYVFLLPGKQESDPETGESAYRTYKWKSKVTVFLGDAIERVQLPAFNCEVTALGYNPKTWEKLDIQQLTPGSRGAAQILLLPFLLDEESPEGLDDIDLPFDYIGLGQKVLYKGNVHNKIIAPGLFEPQGFSSQLSHGYFLCSLNISQMNQVSLTRQFVKAASREFVSMRVNLTKELTYDEVEKQISGTIGRFGKKNVYEIILEGEMSPSVFRGKGKLMELGLVTEVKDRTNRETTLRAFKGTHEDDAIGRFVDEVLQEDDELHLKAFEFGMKALLDE